VFLKNRDLRRINYSSIGVQPSSWFGSWRGVAMGKKRQKDGRQIFHLKGVFLFYFFTIF
jgi:hypothetical protein